MDNIREARWFMSKKVTALVSSLLAEDEWGIVTQTGYLFETIGFIRGRCHDQRSEECKVLHSIKHAALERDADLLTNLHLAWATLRTPEKTRVPKQPEFF